MHVVESLVIQRMALAFALLTVLWSLRIAAAEDDADPPSDVAFAVQGEYAGKVTRSKGQPAVGVQVIALANDSFRAVYFPGGLPGAGADTVHGRILDGKKTVTAVSFQHGDETLSLHEGVLTVMNAQSEPIGKLDKVHRRSSTLGAKPPSGAIKLFDGKNADQFAGGKMTEDGLLMPGATSKQAFRSGTLHVEFRIPFDPQDASRGNSGVYLQSRYEVQILNSFGLKAHNHECGGIPSVKEPDVNMSFPPDSWQTYDIDFTAAEYRDDKKVKNARMTVRHNGVVVHDDVEVPHATTSSPLKEGPAPAPIYLQEHGGDVRYRNIWFLERK